MREARNYERKGLEKVCGLEKYGRIYSDVRLGKPRVVVASKQANLQVVSSIDI